MEKLIENPENIKKATNAILKSLDEKTCWGSNWNQNNPLAGHCRVVSAVIHKLFGGDIKWARIDEKTTHYWNLLPSGKELDLTREQFGESVKVPKGIVITIEETLKGPTMAKTYPVLLKRTLEKL